MSIHLEETTTVVKPRSLSLVPERQRIQHAGFVTRFVALALDILIVTFGDIVFAGMSSVILSFFGISGQGLSLDGSPLGFLDLLQIVIVGITALIAVLFVPAYFVVFWTVMGATPGKLLLGLQVVRTNRGHLGWFRSLLRFVGYWISAIVFFLGFLWVFVDRRRQGWHDKIADTFVVYTWDAPSDE